ncbi:hypothetical protein ITX31_09825 [Arthrobacter gandavensis]|uniref:DUF6297 family protein n=1 Tax=Arthrobacter gandavensis TaxID=169960 RepID=UPI0018904F5B|nr:DUF6297 family protein [Arthrobacter gandavensis]MBF4994409.1 hypothetical protein [Arthrobacter gandavensis]
MTTDTVQTAPSFNPVRYTRQASRAFSRGRTRLRDAFVDVYTAVLALGTIAALAVGLVLALREQVAQAWDAGSGRTLVAPPSFALPDGTAAAVLVFAALVMVMTVARKFGPAAVSGPEGYWWLSLPLDRRPMVAGRLVRRLAAVGAGAAVLYPPFGFVMDLEAGAAGQLLTAGTFGVAAVCAVLLAAWQQARPTSRAAAERRRGMLAGVLVLALLSLITVRVAAGSWALAITGLCVTGALGLLVFSRLDRIPGRELIRGGAVSGHAGAAVYLMDLNEVGRALSAEPDGVASGRSVRWYARGGRTPFGALLRADTAAFLRTRGLWIRPVLVLAVFVVVLLAGGAQPPLVQLGMIAVAVLVAVPALGAVARRTAIMPGLDMLLPLPASVVRLSRMALPAAALALWTAVVCAMLFLLGAGDPSLITLGALAGVGFGASSVRGAYRVQPDWSIPPKDTPFGPMPSAQAGSMIRGFDTTLLALVPLLLGLFLGHVPGGLLLAQAGFSTVCVLVLMYSSPK